MAEESAEVTRAQREHAARLASFTAELGAVAAALDPRAGWYAAFARRSPGELAGWLAGEALPPWDVADCLLRDLAAVRGREAAARTARSLRERYDAVVRAEDALPGAEAALAGRAAKLQEQQARLEERARRLAAKEVAARRSGREEEAGRLALSRRWLRDDASRVAARLAELSARRDALRPAAAGEHARPEPWPPRESTAPPAAAAALTGPPPRRAPRGARFAGLDLTGQPGGHPGERPAPAPAAPPPRGARFAGAPAPAPARDATQHSEEDRRAAADATARLRRLRAEGDGGAAHALLTEAANGPAGRFAALVAALHGAGMPSDAALLLWEAAALPPERLAAAARALTATGRDEDCASLLRQSAARPAPEAGSVAARLSEAGQTDHALALLASVVRAKTPSEAARAAERAPGVVTPLLLDAADRVSPGHRYALLSELRRRGSGLTG